jgi:dienelactone hydrolase
MRTRTGELGAIYRVWAERLAQAGYLGVVLDSFSGRGIEEICTQQQRTLRAARDRARDAYVALDWLLAQEQVDGKRVFLLGWSNGGVAVLGAMDAKSAVGAGRERGFRAALAMYPGCRGFGQDQGYRPRAPLLIQIGAADDWTPAERCRELLAGVPVGSPPVEVVVYPGAQHAFDRPGSRTVFRAEVWNAGRGSRGATIGGHPEAREAALERGLAFFAQF